MSSHVDTKRARGYHEQKPGCVNCAAAAAPEMVAGGVCTGLSFGRFGRTGYLLPDLPGYLPPVYPYELIAVKALWVQACSVGFFSALKYLGWVVK